ncbi:serine/arginine repetitive matrix protein 2-like [Sorex araneus]|uniref:serine/arginine repetitive matrix protein 2-like n=1 Tax=Sorex araneus TaxID=42254 RepID=UPI002433FDB4|nr:serine/arginine repetitive matrix protein 2-like [Sorex araneus]
MPRNALCAPHRPGPGPESQRLLRGLPRALPAAAHRHFSPGPRETNSGSHAAAAEQSGASSRARAPRKVRNRHGDAETPIRREANRTGPRPAPASRGTRAAALGARGQRQGRKFRTFHAERSRSQEEVPRTCREGLGGGGGHPPHDPRRAVHSGSFIDTEQTRPSAARPEARRQRPRGRAAAVGRASGGSRGLPRRPSRSAGRGGDTTAARRPAQRPPPAPPRRPPNRPGDGGDTEPGAGSNGGPRPPPPASAPPPRPPAAAARTLEAASPTPPAERSSPARAAGGGGRPARPRRACQTRPGYLYPRAGRARPPRAPRGRQLLPRARRQVRTRRRSSRSGSGRPHRAGGGARGARGAAGPRVHLQRPNYHPPNGRAARRLVPTLAEGRAAGPSAQLRSAAGRPVRCPGSRGCPRRPPRARELRPGRRAGAVRERAGAGAETQERPGAARLGSRRSHTKGKPRAGQGHKSRGPGAHGPPRSERLLPAPPAPREVPLPHTAPPPRVVAGSLNKEPRRVPGRGDTRGAPRRGLRARLALVRPPPHRRAAAARPPRDSGLRRKTLSPHAVLPSSGPPGLKPPDSLEDKRAGARRSLECESRAEQNRRNGKFAGRREWGVKARGPGGCADWGPRARPARPGRKASTPAGAGGRRCWGR